ncbi:MAG: VOC family protein [Gammaproteobacteria bacterium]
MIKIKMIDHVVLRAENPEKMIDFYCNVLGCRLERQSSKELGLYQLRAGRSLIDIVSVDGELGRRGGVAPGPEGRNLDHFCLRVDPFDVQAIRAFLLSRGIETGNSEIRYGAGGFGPSIYLRDPEGNVVELKGEGKNGNR